MLSRTLSAIGLLSLLSIPAFASEKCELLRYGELPVTMQNMRPLVKGTINGQPALFEMDSGAFYSMLTHDAAEKFDIRWSFTMPLALRGISGQIKARVGRTKDFTLEGLAGGRVLHRVEFVVGSYTAADGIDGVIGQNILGNADAEYDLANGIVRLFKIKGCLHMNLAYWAGAEPIVTMPITGPSRKDEQIIGHALLNGKPIRVLFDTGSTDSTLTLHAAKRIGMSPGGKDMVAAGLSRGISNHRVENWVAHFDSLDLNGEIIKNTQLNVSDMDDLGADLLLGADFFLSHRIFVSTSHHRVYFTYNGGPVFDFAGSDRKAETGQAEAGSAEPAKKADASGLKRRAMALANRHEYEAALAAFDDVIRLAPQDADNYLQRGLIYMAVEKPKPALNDLNQALKINPALVKALVARGSYYLWQNDDSAAKKDFDAAIHAAKPDSTVQLDIGSRYLYQNKFKQAVSHFTEWIDANPKSDQLPIALTERCRARAFWNQDLKNALDDCRLALHKVRGDSRMFGNIALVYLRLGNYNKAVYYFKKSIDLQPKSEWSLYGLGIAEERNGSKADGARSIQAALAINPHVADFYKSVGLKP